MAIIQIVIIVCDGCDGCGIEREYPGASTLDAIHHATGELKWWRGLLKREDSQHKEPTFLCQDCCARQGSNPVLIKSP